MTQEPPAQTPAPLPPARSRWPGVLNAFGVGIWCIALFLGCLWLYTRNNAFPLEFHPDEPGKVRQVVDGYRNYLHPQLMLEATEIWRKLRPTADDPQEVVIAGRQVSAFFGAAAAMMLALTAYLCARWWGLILGSVLLGLCPAILTYSHYMKEDASLIFGIAMVVLASRIIWITKRWYARIPAWILLAAGCALAASGKYVGAMAIALPVALIFLAPGFRWYRPNLRLLLFVPFLALCLGLINHRALNPAGLDLPHVASHPQDWRILFKPSFLEGLEQETLHSQTQHWFLTARQPNTYMVRTSWHQSWPYAAIPAIALPLILLLTRRNGWGWELLLILFAVTCGIVLSHSVILFERYALPLTVLVHLMAVIALARLLVVASAWPVTGFTLGVLATLLSFCAVAPKCLDYTQQFGNDSRFALRDWARFNIPRGARIYADDYAKLNSYSFLSLRPDVSISTHFILPIGYEYALHSREDRYIVICDLSYSRYFEPSAIAAPGYEAMCARAKNFYEELLQKHEPIWSSRPHRPMRAFTNPDIYVYHLLPGE